MGLKGNLSDISLENIFQMLFVEKKDGLLSISHGVRKAEVFLEKGRISFAKLGGEGEGLRVKLAVVKNGYLTEQQWTGFVDSDTSPKVEKILSDLYGHISGDLFSFLYLREMKYTFFCLLQWRSGLYEYSQGKSPLIDKRLLKSLSGEYMLLEALREVERWRSVQAKLPSLNSSVLMVDNLLSVASNARYTLTPDEAYLASMASEEIILEDLLNSSKLSYCETGKIIEKFMSHRLLRVRRALKEVSPVALKAVSARRNRWVEYVVLLLLTVCLLAISDAAFFCGMIKKYLNGLLWNELSETVVRKDDDLRGAKWIKRGIIAEKSLEVAPVNSAENMENKTSVKEGEVLSPENRYPERGEQQESVGDEKGGGMESEEASAADLEVLLLRAGSGDVDAQLSLGFLYDFGRGGVAEDDVKAAIWYRRAAEEGGHPEAQFNLGVMYKNGEGVGQDSVEAATWYRRSASQGNSQARYNLALMYLDGDGVEPNKEKAVELLYRAGVSFWKEGNEDAVLQVVKVLRKIDPNSIDAKKLLIKISGENR